MKEKERKVQLSIVHNNTNIFEWFYIPIEQLVLTSDKTLISIPIAKIKYYAWCSFQWTLHFVV